ncbi:GNAT family N-acetyltransferase [Lysobacter niastensis]|uniref:GNAT family N-acetyltransferase n=1 Tax=Lysobacter niastensis TaxID=380629 RepID=A0ABS0B758_9GAMM|nr:GNAT family N-acetyltransferase [Lysobacter niastensis]MBF6024830.1 GNAT family N-acetyltransferase [Lysobacter niastensis]
MNTTVPITGDGVGPEYPQWTETLRDRSQVSIRPITADDAARERQFILGLSPQARRFRFLGQVSHPSDVLIRQLTAIDYVHQVAFAAVVQEDGVEKIVGTSRYATDPQGLYGECAVTVDDHWQNRGLGTVLMKHLIEVARGRGIRCLTSIDAADNIAMRDLASYLGFLRREDPGDAGQVIHELDLQGNS